MSALERAWKRRQELGVFKTGAPLRVFHGPGEAQGVFENLSIDLFGGNFWITAWTKIPLDSVHELLEFLKKRDAKSVVMIEKLKGDTSAAQPTTLLGSPPEGAFEVCEGDLKFLIRFRDSDPGKVLRHPGLFLDHASLRQWLLKNSRDKVILNAFAYTGSLSVSCGIGGAKEVTSLDLSQPALNWARENWSLNGLPEDRHWIVKEDYFDWMKRQQKKGKTADCIILDPPSFSRGSKKTGSKEFSTANDLIPLHIFAVKMLNPGGILITSINSANVPRKKFQAEVLHAFHEAGSRAQILEQISLPEDTFPTVANDPEAQYLKGLILKKD